MAENPRALTRRTILAGGAAIGTTLLGPWSRPAVAAPSALRVATYGGAWRDSMVRYVQPILEKREFQVEYTLDNPSGFVARLVQARGREAPFDVMESGTEYLAPLTKAGLIQKIDISGIPNAKNLPAFARSEYYVAPLATVQGIVYNAGKFKEAGVAPPETFSDLANPKLAGRVAFPEITQGSSHYAGVVGLAYDAGGDEGSLEKALPVLKQINPAYFYASSSDMSTKFGSGEIWAAPWHNGYATRLRLSGLPIQFAYPHYGTKRGAIVLGLVHVPAGSKNLPGALAFADAYLSPDAQVEIAKTAGMLPLNNEARDRLRGTPEGEGLPLTDAERDNCLLIDYSKIDANKWRDQWQRGVSR